MAKALFFNVPTSGHVNPTLPVVQELVSRGEHVIYYLTPGYREKIESTGAEFRPYAGIGDDYFDIHGLDGSIPPKTAAILAKTCDEMLPELLNVVAKEKPDYLLHDSMCPWGWLLGQVTGLPTISSNSLLTVTIGMVLRSGLLPRFLMLSVRYGHYFLDFQRAVHRLKQTYRVSMPSFTDFMVTHSTLTISYTSADFQPDSDSISYPVAYVGPAIQTREDTSDFPLGALDERSLIYISLGTVINQNIDFYRVCIAAFADSPYQIVMSVGQHMAIADLGTLPQNFIVRNFVPQLDILQRASLFISHGGMNSVHESLYFDVPLLIVPQQDEQNMVGHRVVELHVGELLKRNQATANNLRQKADDILKSRVYRKHAEALGKSFRAAGGYQRAADEAMALMAR